MTIGFNQVPSNARIPFVYTEFDNSGAVQGVQNQPFKVLLIGQRLSGGAVAKEVPTKMTSKEQGRTAFGSDSMLAEMVEAFLESNKVTELWAVALDDEGSGVQATGKLTFSGPATEDGTVHMYLGGKYVPFAVANEDTNEDVAAAAHAAIAAATAKLQVSSAVDGEDLEEVNLTFKHKGLIGNYFDIRFNMKEGEKFPAGVGCTITALSGGTTNPDVDLAIAAIGDTQFNVIVCPYTDETSFDKIEAELDDRWGPITQNDGHMVTASNVAYGSLGTLGDSRNSKHSTIMYSTGSPSTPWAWAAETGALIALYEEQDPARPLQNVPYSYVQAPKLTDQLKWNERNLLLFDGISTFKVESGKCIMERVITTYKTNEAGADDISYLSIEPKFTLSFIRKDWRNYILGKYPRHKLADDGIRISSSSPVMTPKLMKSEHIARAREWETLGLVENAAAFKAGLVVERQSGDPDRLNSEMTPDLVNQFRVMGTKIKYLL